MAYAEALETNGSVEQTPNQPYEENISNLLAYTSRFIVGMRFCTTSQGYFGIVPGWVEEGDL